MIQIEDVLEAYIAGRVDAGITQEDATEEFSGWIQGFARGVADTVGEAIREEFEISEKENNND